MSCEHDCDRPALFPAPIRNRPGLSHFRYRIGDYATMRGHMLDRLVKAPALAGWTHLGPDEPGIALLEGAALLGDILTFYQELYANETKLPTAAWQDSIFNLVRLTGYRPAPGLGGAATFALDVAETTIVPAGFAFQAQLDGFEKPSIFESTAAIEALPAFGAFHLYRRRKGLQPIKGATSLDIVKLGGRTDLATRADHGIKAGDRVLILSGPLDPYEIVVVKDTVEHLDRVTLNLEGIVQEDHPAEVTAFRIGRSFRHFGADAPREFATYRDDPPKTTMHDTKFDRRTAGTSSPGVNYTSLGPLQFPLDSEVDDLAAGSRVICVGRVSEPAVRDFAFVRRIQKVVPRDVLWAGVTAPVSMLLLNASLRTDSLGGGTSASLGVAAAAKTGLVLTAPAASVIDAEAIELMLFNQLNTGVSITEFQLADTPGPERHDIRRLRIHETLGEKMILRAPPKQVPSAADGKVSFFGTREEAEALAARRLLLAGPAAAPQDIVVAAEQPEMAAAQAPAGDRLMWPIQLGATPEAGADGFAEDAPTVTVHGNIVDATEGESQPEVAIGSGDARQTFQTFPIPKAPLTFLSDPARSPPYSAELEIRVAGRLWQPAAAFFDRPADAEIYIVRQGEDGAYVQFGDGINGAALPSGRNNVTAAYRIGAGAHGGLAAGAEPKPKGKLKPLTGVTMPGPATGGAEPEDMAGARVAAPGRMQSLGRLVGLADYVAEALAIPGVVKAGAVFGAEAERQHIALTVLTEDESPEAIAAVEAALRHADRCRGPARYPLEVIGGRRRFVHISLTAGYDPAYRSGDLDAAIIAALGALPAIDGNPPGAGLFALAGRSFGQDVHISQAVAAAQSVEGVVWVKPAAFARLAAAETPADIAVPKKPGLAARLTAGPSEVLALSALHLTLSATSVTSDEECPA